MLSRRYGVDGLEGKSIVEPNNGKSERIVNTFQASAQELIRVQKQVKIK